MAKVRRIRTRPASPSEVTSTTVGLLTPQEGQEMKSTVIKYQNLRQGSKLYDQETNRKKRTVLETGYWYLSHVVIH
jgi:hypothetical protein